MKQRERLKWVKSAPEISEEQQAGLVKAGDWDVLGALVERSDLSLNVALELAGHGMRPYVRKLCSGTRNESIMKKLALSTSTAIKSWTAENPGLSAEAFAILAVTGDTHTRTILAKKDLSTKMMRKLAARQEYSVLITLLGREDAPEWLAREAVESGKKSVLEAVSSVEKWALIHQETLREGPQEVKANLARYQLEPETVEYLFAYRHSFSEEIARQQALTPQQVQVLIREKDSRTLGALAANPVVKGELLERFVRGQMGESGSWGAMRNPNLPEELMHEVIDSGDEKLMVALALAEVLPDTIQERLAFESISRQHRVPLELNKNLHLTERFPLPFLLRVLGPGVRDFFQADISEHMWKAMMPNWGGSLADLEKACQELGPDS